MKMRITATCPYCNVANTARVKANATGCIFQCDAPSCNRAFTVTWKLTSTVYTSKIEGQEQQQQLKSIK
jgi:hypothetical protein